MRGVRVIAGNEVTKQSFIRLLRSARKDGLLVTLSSIQGLALLNYYVTLNSIQGLFFSKPDAESSSA